ncbi:MAG: hypothetical protein FJY85_26350, partial [Deltaproteobacteria bacterium]|nr:hypothetical protein [Deltaproteobacteria bacterium]
MTSSDQLIPDSTWFTHSVVYAGRGRAEFADPRGFIEGPATASFDEKGSAHISLQVEDYGTDEPLRFGLLQLLSRGRPQKTGKGFSLGLGGLTNPCTRFTINTPDGVFSMSEKITLGATLHGVPPSAGTLQFNSIWSTFEAKDAGPTRYWVLPLFNFATGLASATSDLDSHPLRLSPPLEVPPDLQGQARIKAQFLATLGDRLIPFEFDGEPGFIEQVPDIRSRRERLSKGEVERIITAVIVGSQRQGPPDWRDLTFTWKPLHLVDLLGLAGGVRIAPAWVEFRDGAAKLVCRVHAKF